jgi:predicted 3-demethylubiquinone-9 3-methyltransferase (glyoxalase superfamily)
MSQNKITPALWFHTEDGKMQHVTSYYTTIFADNFEAGNVTPLGETPSGYTEMNSIKLFGNEYLYMTTSIEHHAFNDSFAIMIHCDDQQEIDKCWDYFTKDGKESMCGWCMDKFGLRWQIIPKNFDELMSKPNAWQVMMKQKKIIIEEYLR